MNINKNKIAYLFPGQGSQQVGMGMDIANAEADAKNVFRIVNDQCNFDLHKVAWTGPDKALQKTIHTQPSLYATSAACLQALRKYYPDTPMCVAGHSLGEFTALWASGVYNLEDGAKLTVRRGELMQASPEGSMAAILGYDQEDLNSIINNYSDVVVANYNTSAQQVISGTLDGIRQITTELTKLKVKVIPLPVGGAFHSPLMKNANKEFSKIIQSINFQDAQCPIIQNVTAQAHTTAQELQANLTNQMTSSVYWIQSIQTMISMGVECFVEIGPGRVLSGLVRKIDKSIPTLQIGCPDSLKTTLETLQS